MARRIAPHNYDEKFEGTITLRRALAGSRNVPAVKLAERVGINSVVDITRRFGITAPLPPYLPLALGAADMRLIEHVSAFTVFPNEGIRIDPHMIRRVTSYDGALLEDAHPEVHDVISPEVAHTMTAMLEEVVQFGTAMKAKTTGRPAGGKTGTTRILPTPGSSGLLRRSPQVFGSATMINKFPWARENPARRPRCRFGSNSLQKGMAGMPAVEFRQCSDVWKTRPPTTSSMSTCQTPGQRKKYPRHRSRSRRFQRRSLLRRLLSRHSENFRRAPKSRRRRDYVLRNGSQPSATSFPRLFAVRQRDLLPGNNLANTCQRNPTIC